MPFPIYSIFQLAVHFQDIVVDGNGPLLFTGYAYAQVDHAGLAGCDPDDAYIITKAGEVFSFVSNASYLIGTGGLWHCPVKAPVNNSYILALFHFHFCTEPGKDCPWFENSQRVLIPIPLPVQINPYRSMPVPDRFSFQQETLYFGQFLIGLFVVGILRRARPEGDIIQHNVLFLHAPIRHHTQPAIAQGQGLFPLGGRLIIPKPQGAVLCRKRQRE